MKAEIATNKEQEKKEKHTLRLLTTKPKRFDLL